MNIRWQASVWGQTWRQIGYRDVSIPGRLFRLLMIVWNVPIMLIGLLFRSGGRGHEDQGHSGSPDGGEQPMAKVRSTKGT